MPQHYFGGAPNAFAGGQMFEQDQRKRRHQENALNAMIARFGPEAADPTSLGQLEGIDQRRQMFPHQLATAEHQGRLQPLIERGAERDDAQGEADWLRGAAKNAAHVLRHARDTRGDVLAAFDRVAEWLPQMGLPVESVAGFRQAIAADPAAADEIVAMLLSGEGGASGRMLGQGQAFLDNDGNVRFMQFGPDGRPQEPLPGWIPVSVEQAQERIRQRDRDQSFREDESVMPSREPGVVRRQDPYSGEVWSEITPGSPAAFNRMKQISEMQEAGNDAIYAIQFRVDQAGTVQTLGNRAMPIIQERDKYGVMRATARISQSRIPGTEMYRLKDMFEDIKANIGIDELIAIKRDGTGLGHIPMTQLQSLQRMLTDLHVGRDFKDVEEDLNNIMRIYQRLVDGGLEDIANIRQRNEWLQNEWGNVQGRPGGSTRPEQTTQQDDELEALLQQYGGGV